MGPTNWHLSDIHRQVPRASQNLHIEGPALSVQRRKETAGSSRGEELETALGVVALPEMVRHPRAEGESAPAPDRILPNYERGAVAARTQHHIGS
jgi:hypothetical protein